MYSGVSTSVIWTAEAETGVAAGAGAIEGAAVEVATAALEVGVVAVVAVEPDAGEPVVVVTGVLGAAGFASCGKMRGAIAAHNQRNAIEIRSPQRFFFPWQGTGAQPPGFTGGE